LSGIPGLVGATPIQNVGAYGQEVAETIESVGVLDRETLVARTLTAAECRFAYRDSFFKSEAPERYVVTSVVFRLRLAAAPAVRYAELERRLAEDGLAPADATLERVRQYRARAPPEEVDGCSIPTTRTDAAAARSS
jgi:UDP-N-acetylmuramate dehydrogenase